MLALAALLLAAVTPAPRPSAQQTNPFTLEPLPATAAPVPYIGRTRSRALCTAFRRAVAPAVQAAMQTDRTYAAFRTNLYDYIVKGNETSRDLMLLKMDGQVQSVVKATDALRKALDSHDFDAPANTASEDVEALTAIRRTMRAVLEAQKVELDAISGFVETERMTRLGQPSESEENMNRAVGLDASAPRGMATSAPSSSAFLRDSRDIFHGQRPSRTLALHDAHLLDRDLGDIAAFTERREAAANNVIVPATERCK